jgi:diguanylate cyclase (GGDEF)-like protein
MHAEPPAAFRHGRLIQAIRSLAACCLGVALASGQLGLAATTTPGPAGDDFAFIDPYFQNVGENDSIPSGVVTSLAQDADGLIWIGTEEGLVRYDGYRFRHYVHNAADPHSLAGSYISSLHVDAEGFLWIGTGSDGLSRYDIKHEIFDNFRHADADPESLGGGMVWAIATDAGGTWVASNSGLDYLPKGGRAWRHYRHDEHNPASLADDRVHNLLIDKSGALWVGTAAGLQRLRADHKGFDSIAEGEHAVQERDIRALFQAADGKVWFGTRKLGAAWMAPGQATPHWLPVDANDAQALSHGWVRAINQPSDGEVWIGTYGGGLNIVDAASGRVKKRLHHDLSVASSIGLDGIGAMLHDRAGQLWLGTWGGGLQRYNPENRAIRVMRHSPVRPESLSQAEVDSVFEQDDNTLLIGTDANGVDIVDRSRGVVGGYRPHGGQKGALADAAIFGIGRTADGALWVGTKQAGAMRLAADSSSWEEFGVEKGLPAIGVSKVTITSKGELWVGTDSGVAHWNPDTERFETFHGADGQPMRAHVYSLEEDHEGRIWAGTDDGLWLREPGAPSMLSIHAVPGQTDGLSSDDIAGLLVDRQGRLWVSTAQGLDRLKSRAGTVTHFEHISTMLGHPGMALGDAPMEDKQGRIWTDSFLIDLAHQRFYNLSKADGMEIGTNWDNSFGKTHDGLLLYGGTQGLAVIDPERFHPWAYQPPVVATELKIDGLHAPLSALENGLTLSPEQRDFSIEFAALDYTAPNKLRYAYRLEGYDRDWIETDAEHRSVSYGNLWPGSYTLTVRGSNRNGDWSPHELKLAVTVMPAFWQTRWFAIAALFAAGLLVYAIYRLRVAQLTLQAENLRRQVAERTAELMEKNKELEQLAVTDRLTNLYNRLYLDHALARELALAQRAGEPFSLIMIDVDRFKTINDALGHLAGDNVLKAIADILHSRVRATDIAGRWGGEEFLLICPGTHAEGAQEVAETLRTLIAESDCSEAGRCTASFGIASFRDDDTVTTLVSRADQALYQAKEKGRNRVEVA